MAGNKDDGRERELRRVLERVSREVEGGSQSALERTARRVRDHVAAADVDRGDWAEYWGTRIGRTIGALILVGLVVWLVSYLAQGG